jgi:hypothetical protein
VWTVELAPGESRDLALTGAPHVVAALDSEQIDRDPAGGVTFHDAGPLRLTNDLTRPQAWFVVALDYLADLATILEGADS